MKRKLAVQTNNNNFSIFQVSSLRIYLPSPHIIKKKQKKTRNIICKSNSTISQSKIKIHKSSSILPRINHSTTSTNNHQSPWTRTKFQVQNSIPIFAMLAKKIHIPMTNGVSTRWNSTDMILYSGLCFSIFSTAWDDRSSIEFAPFSCPDDKLRKETSSGREPSIGPIGPKLLPGYGSLRSLGNSWSSTMGPCIA